MIVFKTFLKVLNKYKFVVIIYSVFLIFFGAFNMQNNQNSTDFTATKPDILIINEDTSNKITNNLIDYITKNSNIIQIEENEQAISDALFYRDVNYIIYIPKDYGKDFLKGNTTNINVKSTGDYQASLAEILLTKYIKVANMYVNEFLEEEVLIEKINETLSKEASTKITSKLDTNNLEKTTSYYNFASYSLLAGSIYVIGLIISTFNNENIRRRTIVSSMKYKKYNFKLFLSNCLFALVLWAIYVIMSIIIIGNIMFTLHGIVYIINSLLFTICAVSIAFLIASIVSNKNAINGIVNVVALGSSFLCGAFVPMEWLPDTVLTISHILPTYYYIKNNEIIKRIEHIDFETLEPVIFNMIIILTFTIVFIIATNIISKRNRSR